MRLQVVNLCRPTDDPAVVEYKHRAICALKLLPKCPSCPHSNFKLRFKADNKEHKQILVKCPRWEEEGTSSSPDSYVNTQVATCFDRPFVFCSSCPLASDVPSYGVDFTSDGWLTRWRRFRKDDIDESYVGRLEEVNG